MASFCEYCDNDGYTEPETSLTITALVTIDRSPGWEHRNETCVEDIRILDDATGKEWKGELTREEERLAVERLIDEAQRKD